VFLTCGGTCFFDIRGRGVMIFFPEKARKKEIRQRKIMPIGVARRALTCNLIVIHQPIAK